VAVAWADAPREPALADNNSRSPTKRLSKEPRKSFQSEVENQPPAMGPPPNRRVLKVSPHNSPVKQQYRLPVSPTKGPPRSPALRLPVARAGSPIPQSSAQGGGVSLLLNGSDSTKSSGSNFGSASGDASGRSLSPPGGSPRTPSRKMRRCRKSVTSLANKAERQGISSILDHSNGTMHCTRDDSPYGSPSPDGGDLDSMPALGLTAQIREGARMHRKSRNQSPRPPTSPIKAEVALGAGDVRAPWLSPERVRRRSLEYNGCKYPLSPVFELGEASTALPQSPQARRLPQGGSHWLAQANIKQAQLEEFIARGRSRNAC